jgi:hypothetical protein
MTGQGARDASGLTRKLSTRTLIILRLTSSFVAYFFISVCPRCHPTFWYRNLTSSFQLFYCLLSLAFNLDFTRKYGLFFTFVVVILISVFFKIRTFRILSFLDAQLCWNASFVSVIPALFPQTISIDRICRGLALESLITLLTPRFIPLFMLTWIISE